MDKYKKYIAIWTIPDIGSELGHKEIRAEVEGNNREHALSKLLGDSIYGLLLLTAFEKEVSSLTFTHEYLMWIDK